MGLDLSPRLVQTSRRARSATGLRRSTPPDDLRRAEGKRRSQLERWLRDELPLRFESRILPVNDMVAKAWGKTVSRSEATGRPMGTMDAFLAATAEIHQLTLVTRNVT
jgi:toxin FitB